ISSFIPGSTIGLLPLLMMSALVGLTSTPMTSCPARAKHAAETQPTYPIPKMLILINSFVLFAQSCIIHRFHRFLCNLWMVFSVVLQADGNKTLRNLPPAEALSHSRSCSLAQLSRVGTVSQHSHDGAGKRSRFICKEQLYAVGERQAFSAHCRRDYCLFHRHRFEDFEPRPTANAQRNYVSGRTLHVRPYIFHSSRNHKRRIGFS